MLTINHALIALCLLFIILLVFTWITLHKLDKELLRISVDLTTLSRGFHLPPAQRAQLWQWNESKGCLEKTPKPTRSTEKLTSILKGKRS